MVITYRASHVLQAWECIEFFAGDGRVGQSTRNGLIATAQLELKYGEDKRYAFGAKQRRQNAFDLTSPCGMASPACN